MCNICPVPIYSGIGNTVMRINQSMGLPYKDQGIKFKGNSKQQIVKVAPVAKVNLRAATNVDKKDFYKNLNMDYLKMDEEDDISMSFSLDGFSEEENQDEQIMRVLDK